MVMETDLDTSQNLTVLSQDPDTRDAVESSALKLHTQPLCASGSLKQGRLWPLLTLSTFQMLIPLQSKSNNKELTR